MVGEVWPSAGLTLLTGGFLSLALGILFAWRRFRATEEDSTYGYRLALTFAAYLFIGNAIAQLAEGIWWLSNEGTFSHFSSSYASRLENAFSSLVIVLLFALPLHLPRPIFGPAARKPILYALVISGILLMVLQAAGRWAYFHEPGSTLDLMARWVPAGYTLGWFVPVALWAGDLAEQRKEEVRLMFAVLFWAIFAHPLFGFAHGIGLLAMGQLDGENLTNIYGILSFIGIIVVLQILWKHEGRWGRPEWLHVISLVLVFTMGSIGRIGANLSGLYDGGLAVDSSQQLYLTFASNVMWAFWRPALFSFVLIRYQSALDRKSLADILSVVFAVTGALVLAILAGVIATRLGVDPWATFASTLLLLLGPAYLASRWGWRLLSGSTQAVPTEEQRRDTYLVTLQSCLYRGKIATPQEEEVLRRLAGRLGITQREHQLLLEELLGREMVQQRFQVHQLFLLANDGRLIAHLGGERGEDADITAGMLAALRSFVATEVGEGGELDSIGYGEYELVIEEEHGLILAAAMSGSESIRLRQHLQDWLLVLNERHRTDLDYWGGNYEAIADVVADLQRMVRPFGRGLRRTDFQSAPSTSRS